MEFSVVVLEFIWKFSAVNLEWIWSVSGVYLECIWFHNNVVVSFGGVVPKNIWVW
jgi:hypothetical protein